ncbi:Ig-like domain-containing protein [Blautia stercoris]
MKNPKRNPVERFCALLLAFIMVFTLVLPDGALSVSAAEGTTIVEFRIKDAGNADSLLVDNQTIKVWKTGENSVTEVPYDSNQGIYSIQLDSNTEYQYSVERNGYEYADGNNTRTFNLGEEDNYLVEVSLKQSVASESEQTENSGTNEEESLPQETETPEQNVENNQEQLLIQPFLGESVPEKPDLNVKTDIEGSTLDITSDGQIDVKSITCTVNGLPEDATGTLTFTIKNSSNEEIGKTELDVAGQGTKWTFDEADKIIGKLSITAFYSGNDKYNQVEYNSAELTYKKTAPINFSKDASNEVVIKDNATKKEAEIDATTIENIKERNLEYSSNDKNIATVDNKGKITAKKAGIATITIKAVENEYYESSELQFTVYVQHAMGLSDLNWTAKKVYDGTKDLKLSSTLKDSITIDGTAISNITATVTATADKAGVSAKNATIKKGEKVTFNGKVNNQNLDEKTLAKLNRCYVFEDSKDALIENAVTITARPLYVRIAKKNGAYESAIPYRTSKKDMESTIKTDNTVVLVGSKGAIDSDKESGLVGKDTVQDAEKALKNQTEIQFNSKEDYSKYYEGLYNKAIVLKVNNAKYDDNYEFKANPDEENLYGRLQITQEVIDDATVGKNISVISAVGESVEESEKNAEKVYQGKDFTWVSASAKIQFVTNLAPYNKVNVAGLETLSMANYADKIKENSIVDISDWKLPIYLESSEGSEHSGMRTTADAKAQNVANKISENKVKVDNEKPTIDFIGEIKDLTRIYTNKEFNVAYQISDNGSGIKEASYTVLSVKNLNTVTSDEIEKAVNAVTNWTPFQGEAKKAGTVKISNEKDANKIVVIKAVDQVGNISACTSNGIVIDITSPEVTLSIDNSKQVNGIYGGNKTAIKYSVNVNDPVKQSDGMEVQSEINRVEIEVQKNDVKDAEHSFVIEGDELEKMKSEEASETGAFIYKIQKEIPVQEESSQIKILVTAFDKAGNSLAKTSETLQVDGKKPGIEAKYDGEKSENGCYKERKLTVTYTEREFSEEKAEFNLTFDGKKPESTVTLNKIRDGEVDGVSLEGEPEIEAGSTPDDKKTTYTIKFGKEKFDCTIKLDGISLTDQAGNTNSVNTANEEFTVDQVAPKIEVEFNNNDVKNGKYFNAIRQMTVTYTERNFDENNLRFKVSGEDKTLEDFLAINGIKQVGTRIDNGNEHKYTFEFGADNQDFDFNVTPEITDKSGNANQGVTYTEGTKAGKEFTVDMVAPTLEVKYIVYQDENGQETKKEFNITKDIDKAKTEDLRFYKNAPISVKVTIDERNFFTDDESFAKDQMKLEYKAQDITRTDVETTDFKKQANNEFENKKWVTDKTTRTQTFKFEVEANYALGINYTDLAGNPAVEYKTHYFTVDKTSPEGTVVMSDGDKKTEKGSLLEKFKNLFFTLFSNKKITVEMTGKDKTSPFVQKYYIDDKNQEYDKDGNYNFKTEDKLSEETWTVYKDEKAIEKNDYFSVNDKTQTYTLKKENSKAVPYLYLEDKAGNKTYMTSNGAIYDTENPTAPVIKITTADPVAGVSDPGIKIFNSNVDFNISVEDPEVNETYSGLASVSYKIKNNGKVTQEGNFNEDLKPVNMEKRLSRDLTVDASKNNGNNITIEVNAEDNAGNKSSASRELAIDTTKPEITVSYDNNDVANGKYFKANRTMTVSYKERNFYEKGITFDVSTNGGVLQEGISLEDLNKINGITVKSHKDSQSGRKLKELSDERVNTYTILFDAGSTNGDMDYSIVPHITDAAALVNENVEYGDSKAPEKFTIDKKAPVISMAYSAEGETINPGENEVSRVYRNKTITATATIEERNFSNSNSFSENPKQMNLTYDALNFQGSKVNTENYTGTANTRNVWSSNGYTRTKSFEFSVDANYTLGLVYRDLAGNEAVYDTRYFTVDKTAPTGSMTIEDNSGTAKTWIQWIQQVFFDIFTQSQKGVSMTSADETAGVASTQYYKYHPDSESRHTFDGLSTQNLDSISNWSDGYSTSVNADEQVIVYEKITDRAGNVTYINNQEGVIADNTSPTAPEIKITAAEPAQGIYNASVPFTIDVTDPENGGTYAGLKEVSYEITNNGKVTQSGNYNSDLSDPTARVHNIHRSETVNAELNNSNHVTIKVKAVDYAGNQSEATKDLKIDITHPEVTITFDLNNPLNGKYYKTTRTATISVKERNFDTNAVDLKITNTDGTMPSVSGWSISSQAGESDDAINTCRVEFSADGDYNMTMQCKDQAGNESNTVKVDEFTIDKTIPVISVSYDNNSAATPGYYNANRTATITIKEHNFNAAEVNSQITAALQGSGISAPGVGGWSNSGDTHTASVTFSDDGDYTFDIDYTDLAGNAAADYTQDSFTVDKTKPEVEFFDIEDKSANNGVVAPGVKYSDVNYLESGVEIKIEGAEHESKELTGSRSSIANGESIKMNDFEYTQDNDDVYTMTAVISDKAGNKTEKKIMFSVNRFGSNYSFSDTTKEFLDEVYSNSAKDLVITETNVDSLVFNGISYSLDNKTTELKQGTDYTVKETGGEGSWKQYTYTIKKENFEKEGRYSVTIDSEDKATNTMNNKVKESNINFVIDKTPPTVVITGIEESSYRADSRDMSVNVSDNTAVKRLDIMVDGKSVATYSQEDVKEAGGKIVYTLNSSNSKQKVKAVAVDMADNEATSDNHNILITTNLFIQYINNKPLFIGSIIALVLIAGGAIYFFVFRRKKSEDAADAN